MQEQTRAAGNAVMEVIVDLADYLNTEAGFAISESDICNCLSVFMGSGLDIANEKESKYIFRTSFCKNKEQFIGFYDYFHKFLRRQQARKEHAQQYKDLEQKKNDLRTMQSQWEQKQKDAQDKISGIVVQKAKAIQQLKQTSGEDHLIADKYETKLQKLCKGKEFDSELLKKAGKGEHLSLRDLDEDAVKAAEQELMKKAEEALMAGDAKKLKKMQQIANALNALKKASASQQTELQKKIEDTEKKFEQEQKKVNIDLKKQQEEMKKVQQQIDSITRDLTEFDGKDTMTFKTNSTSHRPEFHSGGGSVQLFGDHQAPACASKRFSSLTASERQTIQEYLKQNILSFKTRLTRHLDEMDRSSIDIGETVKNACRTGGIPMVLHYQKPKPGKADLMLVLDVSGSCKEASEMMLTFMYMLKTAFPHGCNAFAFVNSLYDISKLMDVRDNIDVAITQVLHTIPTRGVYSDYSTPIRTLKKKYSPKITKDTILIFMGDARNNRNDPCYNELKFLCRKAKRAYWLNTEEISEWDSADSIASGYARYAKMFEVTNVAELTGFIRDGIK